MEDPAQLHGNAYRHEGEYPRVATHLLAASGQRHIPGNARIDGASVDGSQGKNPRGVRRSGGARMMTLGSLFSGSGSFELAGA